MAAAIQSQTAIAGCVCHLNSINHPLNSFVLKQLNSAADISEGQCVSVHQHPRRRSLLGLLSSIKEPSRSPQGVLLSDALNRDSRNWVFAEMWSQNFFTIARGN